jgi:hypothetical protein
LSWTMEFDMSKKVAAGIGITGAAAAIFYLAIKAKAAPPEDIVLSDLVIEPSEVYRGEPVSIAVTATNIGETKGSYKVVCEVSPG